MILDKYRVWITKKKNAGRLQGNSFSIRKNASIKTSQRGRISLGKALLNENVFLCASEAGSINIEDNVTINRNTIIVAKKNICIGEDTSIGPNVCIYDHDHIITPDGFVKDGFTSSEIRIGKNVWIAANVMILQGSSIGDNSIIGAGTVIKGVIPPNSIVKTNPIVRVEGLEPKV